MSWDVGLTAKVDGHNVEVIAPINYTHNCNEMIREAGFAEWPYKVHGWSARTLGLCLTVALQALRADPDRFRAMNPENGWGDYDSLLVVLAEVRDACEKFPSASVWMFA